MNMWKRPLQGKGHLQPISIPPKRPRLNGPDFAAKDKRLSGTFDLSLKLYVNGFYLQGLLQHFSQNLLSLQHKHGDYMKPTEYGRIASMVNTFLYWEWQRGKIPLLNANVVPPVSGEWDLCDGFLKMEFTDKTMGGPTKQSTSGDTKGKIPLLPSTTFTPMDSCSCADSKDGNQVSDSMNLIQSTKATVFSMDKTTQTCKQSDEARCCEQSTQTDTCTLNAVQGDTKACALFKDCSVQTTETQVQELGPGLSPQLRSKKNVERENAPTEVTPERMIRDRCPVQRIERCQQSGPFQQGKSNLIQLTGPQTQDRRTHTGPQQVASGQFAGKNGHPMEAFVQSRQQGSAAVKHSGDNMTQPEFSSDNNGYSSECPQSGRIIPQMINTSLEHQGLPKDSFHQKPVQNTQFTVNPTHNPAYNVQNQITCVHPEGNKQHPANNVSPMQNATPLNVNSLQTDRNAIPPGSVQCGGLNPSNSSGPQTFVNSTPLPRNGPVPLLTCRVPGPFSGNWALAQHFFLRLMNNENPCTGTFQARNNTPVPGTAFRQPAPWLQRNPGQQNFRHPRFPGHVNGDPRKSWGSVTQATGSQFGPITVQTESRMRLGQFSVNSENTWNTKTPNELNASAPNKGCPIPVILSSATSESLLPDTGKIGGNIQATSCTENGLQGAENTVGSSGMLPHSSPCPKSSSGPKDKIPFHPANSVQSSGTEETCQEANMVSASPEQAQSDNARQTGHTGLTGTLDTSTATHQKTSNVHGLCGRIPSLEEIPLPDQHAQKESDVSVSGKQSPSNENPELTNCEVMDSVKPASAVQRSSNDQDCIGRIPSLEEIPLPDKEAPRILGQTQTSAKNDNEIVSEDKPGLGELLETSGEQTQNSSRLASLASEQLKTTPEHMQTSSDNVKNTRGQIKTLVDQIQMIVGQLSEGHKQTNVNLKSTSKKSVGASPKSSNDRIKSLSRESRKLFKGSNSSSQGKRSPSSLSREESKQTCTTGQKESSESAKSVQSLSHSFKKKKQIPIKPLDSTHHREASTMTDYLISSEITDVTNSVLEIITKSSDLSAEAFKEKLSLLTSRDFSGSSEKSEHQQDSEMDDLTKNRGTMTTKPECKNQKVMTDMIQMRQSWTSTDFIARREMATLTDSCWVKDAWTITRRFKPIISRTTQTCQLGVSEVGTETEPAPRSAKTEQGMMTDRTEHDKETMTTAAITPSPRTEHTTNEQLMTKEEKATEDLQSQEQFSGQAVSESKCLMRRDMSDKGEEFGEISRAPKDEGSVRITIKVKIGKGSNIRLASSVPDFS